MENYYENLITDIKHNISEDKYTSANTLIEAELAMPYIPSEFEPQLHLLHKQCQGELRATTKQKKYDEEDLERLLFASVEEATQAIDILKGSNIRKHLQIVEKYLSKEPHFLIRSLLIECLIDQDISSEIHMDYDGLDVTFIPVYCELPQFQDTFNQAVEQVVSYYENENPTFLQMCIECMIKEMYFKMPFSLGEDEMNPFIYAILEYVYRANSDIDGFNAHVLEKNLANYSGYTLLLDEYDI